MSTFGTVFRVTTFGESHGHSVGCIVDGCPPGLRITKEIIQRQLNRRRPGQSDLTTPRDEKDAVTILSGVENDVTLGSPIALQVLNEDQRQHDYSETDVYPRPSHADFTYLLKYGLKSSSGGGRSSARETIGRVGAGAIAEAYLSVVANVEIVAFVSSVGEIKMSFCETQNTATLETAYMDFLSTVTRDEVNLDDCRCPEPHVATKMKKKIITMKEKSDSIGGTVTCVIRNVPQGLGEPCFDKLEAKLAHAMLSIPASKGFEVGSGFGGTEMQGSAHNDTFIQGQSALMTTTNRSGGIQGGISNGENIYFRVAFKPPATIGLPQVTSRYDGVEGILAARGRHDPCVVPRAVPIVEAMAAIVIMDELMIQNSRSQSIAQLHEIKSMKTLNTTKL